MKLFAIVIMHLLLLMLGGLQPLGRFAHRAARHLGDSLLVCCVRACIMLVTVIVSLPGQNVYRPERLGTEQLECSRCGHWRVAQNSYKTEQLKIYGGLGGTRWWQTAFWGMVRLG